MTNFSELLSGMMAQPEEDLDLARASLYIAGTEYPDLDVDHYLQLLDRLAEDAARRNPDPGDLRESARKLSEFLFLDQGFRGNGDDYNDPKNSYLNQVLDRKLGIPITLSLTYMEVARRLGMVFEGIGLPGHFVIRAGPPEDELYVDPFNAGQILSREDCRRTVENLFQGRVEFSEDQLKPYTKKAFLVRILTNLKHNYSRIEDYGKALTASDLISFIEPSSPGNVRDRAYVYYSLKQYRSAISDLERYLELAPQADDGEEVRRQIRGIWDTLSSLN